jgi:hypothetical protein
MKLKWTQRKLELSESQIEHFETLDSCDIATLSEILDTEQLQKLNAIILKNELKNRGTVATTCSGHLGRLLELSNDDADALFESGKQIFADMQRSIRESNTAALDDALNAMSSDTSNRITGALRSYLESMN